MTYSPVTIEAFGGLNLRDDPGTVGWGAAIDLLNVDFDKRGRVRSRDGYADLTATAGTGDYTSLHTVPLTSNSRFLAFDSGANVIRAFDTSGTLKASSTALLGQTSTCFATFGTPTTTAVYMGRDSAPGLRKYVPSTDTFSSPTATVDGTPGANSVLNVYTMCVEPTSNRLVVATIGTSGPGGASGSRSHVWFSEAGNAEAWTTTNFVQLTPGDGETVEALVAWRDLVFAFKWSKFFVFYGTSTDSTGNPIFNYRPVDTGVGVGGLGFDSTLRAVAGPDAVYFINQRGIYRTTGGPPELISGALDPLFLQTTDSSFQVGSLNQSELNGAGLCWHNDRLLVTLATNGSSTNNTVLVFDPASSTWTAWNLPANALTSLAEPGTSSELLFSYATGTNHVGQMATTYTQDGGNGTSTGAAITSRYRSGFSDLGTTEKKRVPMWRLEGSGSPTFKLSTDFGSLETGATVTLGTSPAVAEGSRKYTVQGRQVSWQVGGTSAWSLNNLVGEVADRKDTR